MNVQENAQPETHETVLYREICDASAGLLLGPVSCYLQEKLAFVLFIKNAPM